MLCKEAAAKGKERREQPVALRLHRVGAWGAVPEVGPLAELRAVAAAGGGDAVLPPAAALEAALQRARLPGRPRDAMLEWIDEKLIPDIRTTCSRWTIVVSIQEIGKSQSPCGPSRKPCGPNEVQPRST